MYLEKVKIWNFRKYGSSGDNGENPGVVVPFHKHFNLLIGENDAGKTAIIDAIKIVMGTSSDDSYKITDEDFHIDNDGNISKEIKIECIFKELTEEEAGIFLDWLTFDSANNYELKVRMVATKTEHDYLGERIEKSIKAGDENFDKRLEGVAKDLIKATYLKPLRDAENELKPGYRSRLAQILKNHQAFRKKDEKDLHTLEEIIGEANSKVKEYFDEAYDNNKTIKSDLMNYLEKFFHTPIGDEQVYNPSFNVVQAKLNDILKRLSLDLDKKPSGLGSLNLLFIATELLLYNEGQDIGTKLTLIEEIEAHLHPQAQLRLIKYLQNRSNKESVKGQFILTTHSTALAASVSLKHLILLNNGIAYPMGPKYTKLDESDYKFLERFLDSTKSNLFFAKGVIFVEGDAENLILPTIAEALGRPLHSYGVSIVNIRNTAFKRYAKIYYRSDEWLKAFKPLGIPVSIVTDVDVRPLMYYSQNEKVNDDCYVIQSEEQITEISKKLEIDVIEINNLLNRAFDTKKELKETLESYGLRVTEKKKNEIADLIRAKLNADIINSLKERKLKNIEDELRDKDSNVETFVAPNWTLEYELALSQLRTYLAIAIHNSRHIDPYESKNKKRIDAIIQEIDNNPDKETVGYEIYKPLLNGTVSKAQTAQELAVLIKNQLEFEEIFGMEELTSLIREDPHLKYLRDAIYHVTGGEGPDDEY